MRVRQAGGADQREVIVVVNLLAVGQHDHSLLTLAHDPLLQHGLQDGIQLLLDVLDEHR